MIFDALSFTPFGSPVVVAGTVDSERYYFARLSNLRGRRQHYGQTLRVGITMVDDNGELDAADAVTLKVMDPYGTVTSYTLAAGTIDNLSLGRYSCLVTVAKSGRHEVQLTMTRGSQICMAEEYFMIQFSPIAERTWLDPTYDRYL